MAKFYKSKSAVTNSVHVTLNNEPCTVHVRKLNMYELLDYGQVARNISSAIQNSDSLKSSHVRDLVFSLLPIITKIEGVNLVNDDGSEEVLNWEKLSVTDKEDLLSNLNFDDLSNIFKTAGEVGRLTEEEKKS